MPATFAAAGFPALESLMRFAARFADGIGGTGNDRLGPSLIFLFTERVQLLTDPIGHVLRQVVDEGKEFVGGHNDYRAENDAHGNSAHKAQEFGLANTIANNFEACAEKTP